MASEASRSKDAVDSFKGSLISLTTKYETRYEGFISDINTEETSIGLKHVRSFGTEGRKKDGQQVPPTDGVYEYILFRRNEIKDVQVIYQKDAPHLETALPIHDDPAIIQSQYSRPETVSTSFPLAASGYVVDPSSRTAQTAVTMSTFQSSIPLYQPGEISGSWRSSPPLNANASGLAVEAQYPCPKPSMSTSLPFAGSAPAADPSSLSAKMAVPRSTSQGGFPLYQPGETLRSWGASPPPYPHSNNFAVPTYWQGFYGPSSGPSHAQKQPLHQPLPMLSMPHSTQQSIYSGASVSTPGGFLYLPTSGGLTQNWPASSVMPPIKPAPDTSAPHLASSNLQGISPLLSPLGVGSLNIPFSTLLLPPQPAASASELSPNLVSNTASSVLPSTAALSTSSPMVSQSTSLLSDTNYTESPGFMPKAAPIFSLPNQAIPLPVAPSAGPSRSSRGETPTLPLSTLGQLLPSGTTTLSLSMSSEPVKQVVEVVEKVSQKCSPSAPSTTQGPLLPLPSPANQKLNEPLLQTPHSHKYNARGCGRERGRGRGNVNSLPLRRFTGEFNFKAMNEKFNKDAVWGDLGKPNKIENKEDIQEEDAGDVRKGDMGTVKVETPVYVKDDFFDSLSSNALQYGQENGTRTRFSEHVKRDSETFGDFPRHRSGRGGRWPGRGGRSRGSYYGREYGYDGRGRGY